MGGVSRAGEPPRRCHGQFAAPASDRARAAVGPRCRGGPGGAEGGAGHPARPANGPAGACLRGAPGHAELPARRLADLALHPTAGPPAPTRRAGGATAHRALPGSVRLPREHQADSERAHAGAGPRRCVPGGRQWRPRSRALAQPRHRRRAAAQRLPHARVARRPAGAGSEPLVRSRAARPLPHRRHPQRADAGDAAGRAVRARASRLDHTRPEPRHPRSAQAAVPGAVSDRAHPRTARQQRGRGCFRGSRGPPGDERPDARAQHEAVPVRHRGLVGARRPTARRHPCREGLDREHARCAARRADCRVGLPASARQLRARRGRAAVRGQRQRAARPRSARHPPRHRHLVHPAAGGAVRCGGRQPVAHGCAERTRTPRTRPQRLVGRPPRRPRQHLLPCCRRRCRRHGAKQRRRPNRGRGLAGRSATAAHRLGVRGALASRGHRSRRARNAGAPRVRERARSGRRGHRADLVRRQRPGCRSALFRRGACASRPTAQAAGHQ